mmetsp:Transcript_65204/g.76610  ORF Transcript_65204/g.76610 Transcript_65204/m.76610 type:complete len:234 (+) Transcript_65204:260-961(+)
MATFAMTKDQLGTATLDALKARAIELDSPLSDEDAVLLGGMITEESADFGVTEKAFNFNMAQFKAITKEQFDRMLMMAKTTRATPTLAATATATSFIVFEAQSRRTTTSDSRGLLCGVEPSGSGDWDCTIKAKPKNADSGDSPTYEDYQSEAEKRCKTLEDVMYLLSCDHKYICPTGSCPVMSSAKATEPCACWQGKKNIPQNVDEVCEFDGNSGEVFWETDTHFFEMQYATS